MEKQDISKIFLLFLVAAIIYLCYLLLKPFLTWLLIGAVLTTVFYPWYGWFFRAFKGRKALASLAICLLVTLIVIAPISALIFYSAARIIEAFPAVSNYFSPSHINGFIQYATNNKVLSWAMNHGIDFNVIKDNALNLISGGLEVVFNGAKAVFGQMISFLISIPIILFTMFFFFMDGRAMLEKLMHWTPLPNKYDKIIFKKFHNVSRSVLISIFITAAAQGAVGGIGFLIVGLPAFFPAVAMGFFSLVPYVGTAIIWLPASVYLLFIGKIWQGIILIIWGTAIIGTVDNLIRAFWIKGKAHVHPIFLIFSVLGGLALFGFWGLIFGPIIISLTVTILHIYEIEYEKVLEK